MKLTIYSDKDCVIRYSVKGWPKEPNANSPAYHAIDNTFYNLALQKAKDESISFEDEKPLIKLIAFDQTILDYEKAKRHYVKPDTFYSVDIPGEVEVVTFCGESPDGHPAKERGKVARIVAKEEKKEKPIQECKDQIAYKMRLTWDKVRKHHSVRGMETTMGEVAELYVESLRKENSELKKEIERLKERALL